MISLLNFWRLQRAQQGLQTIIRPCHVKKANALTQLMLGQLPTPNLMILEPPRVGKTDLTIKAFIPWSMSFFKDSENIITSYGAELSDANSVYIRNTLASDWYRSIRKSDFGATVEMRGVSGGGRQDYFKTKEGGYVKSVGVGSGITGWGAGKLREAWGGAIFIDDPLKAQEAIKSPVVRQACIDWYHGTLESRRNRKENPMTPIVLDMQRLDVDDLAGHLLKTERDRWTVVQIPAIDEQGESIWPARISLEELEHIKEADPQTFWSQYMQEPSMGTRSIFKDYWWGFYRNRLQVEKRLTLKYITADTAFEEKVSADWSVFQCWGIEGTSAMFLIDQIRGQWAFPDLLEQAEQFWKKHNTPQKGITPATEFWIENKASGISLVQSLRKWTKVPARPWEPKDKTAKDKVGRAKQCTMPLSTKRIFLLCLDMIKKDGIWKPVFGKEFAWVEKFMNEHSAFTDDNSHLNDDQVDAHTEANSIWQERGGGTGPLPIPFFDNGWI